tara:strand:- start:47 stop:592 length:546 start_codon:yes stop_codon:yes gene_type:complete
MDFKQSWYHGTRTPNITEFWPLSHFGDINSAKMVCANKAYKDGHEGDPLIIEVKLNIKEEEVFPFFDVGSPNPKWIAVQMLNEKETYPVSEKLASDIENVRAKLVSLKAKGKSDAANERSEFSAVLIKHGFKAICYPNEVESETNEVSLCVLEPSAIEIINVATMCESEARRLWDKSARNV